MKNKITLRHTYITPLVAKGAGRNHETLHTTKPWRVFNYLFAALEKVYTIYSMMFSDQIAFARIIRRSIS